jgi:hypothetical protein
MNLKKLANIQNSFRIIIKKESFFRAGRVGHGQKPEQRPPKSRTKWDETQGGARSFSGAFAFGTKALPALRITHLERLCGRPMFLALNF